MSNNAKSKGRVVITNSDQEFGKHLLDGDQQYLLLSDGDLLDNNSENATDDQIFSNDNGQLELNFSSDTHNENNDGHR